MFIRFTEIVNGLAHQGKLFTDGVNVNTMLRQVPKERNNVKTSIRETMRIQTILMNELIGTFTTYEVEQQNEEGNSKDKKVVDFKVNHDETANQIA